ncbi:hypothetical protein NECAME_07996 [Necator americanus]|uniref:Uncharacterized protein n=1 Tax=Necator americanus TaxID=51031 RepID=W2TLB1_NECAM|nr:hypothetical protein NECAME_07996 [Necator americanus]ETN82419.1 hypothetical protein NECAME_07996 [Necator americanus]
MFVCPEKQIKLDLYKQTVLQKIKWIALRTSESPYRPPIEYVFIDPCSVIYTEEPDYVIYQEIVQLNDRKCMQNVMMQENAEKYDCFQSESLADSTKCQTIDRLSYNASPTILSAWQNVANTLAFTYERILQLPSVSFWSSVVYNKTIMQSFDAVLNAIPRRFEIDEYRLIFCYDSSVAVAADRLYNSAFIFLLNEKQNLQEHLEGCQKEQQEYIERALESICESQRAEIVKELEKSGMLTLENLYFGCDFPVLNVCQHPARCRMQRRRAIG